MGKRRVARGAAAAAIAAKRDAHVVPQLPYPGDPVKKGERSSLFRVLARTPFNSSVRAPAGASEDGAAPNHLSSLHLPSTHLRARPLPLSPRALTRSRYGGAALGLPSRDRRMLRARTQRAARRNQHRMWSLG